MLAGKLTVGQPFQVTTDTEEYRQATFPKINYSNDPIQEGELHIKPEGLLFESGIKEKAIEVSTMNRLAVFFRQETSLGFDIFSASFFLVSRYEEYLPHTEDEYGRYGHVNSLAAKNGFLDQPLVNKWMASLREKLGCPDPNQFEFLATYDIDEAWSYSNKSWWRSNGGMIRDLLKGNWTAMSIRRKVLAGERKDPYDSFDWMDAIHAKYGLKPIYFFLLARANGKYDKNNLPSVPAMRDLIQRISYGYQTGIHPSWQSRDRPELLKKEISAFDQLTGRRTEISRQHFLRFKLPDGYRQLMEAGIREDHSMGYGTINGFRASIASSFYWYDLQEEKATDLLIHPFCFMDANSFYEMKQGSDQAFNELMHYYNEVRQVNGRLITLWHNTFLGTEKRFEGWKEMYERFLLQVSRD